MRIPKEAFGVCAMVRLGAPLLIIGEKVKPVVTNGNARLTIRRRCQVLSKGSSWSFDLTANSPNVYRFYRCSVRRPQ